MSENGSWYNWMMIEIEKYPCKDGNEARARERFWYEELQATLNSQCPSLDIKKRKDYKKDYYVLNKDQINEYYKDYYVQNKDIMNGQQKEYREKNKDKIKDYYIQNKVKFNEKHLCKCGGCFTTANRSTHNKTKMHLKYIQENESE